MASSENVYCKVSRVKLTGGYTRDGSYFGVDAPLFRSEQWADCRNNSIKYSGNKVYKKICNIIRA